MTEQPKEGKTRKIRLSLANRLALLLVAGCLIVAVIISTISYKLLEGSLEKQLRLQLSSNVSAISGSVANYLSINSQHLLQLSEDKALLKYTESFNELALLSLFENYSRYFQMISYANERGVEEVKTQRDGEELQLEDLSSTELFQSAAAQPNTVMISDASDIIGEKPYASITLGSYIVNYFGRKLGYIAAELGLSDIAGIVEHHPVEDYVQIILIDRNGRILYDNDNEHLGQSFYDLYFRTDKTTHNEVSTFRTTTSLNRDYFVATTVIPDYGWQTFCLMKHEHFVAPLVKLRSSIAITVTALALLIAAGGGIHIRKLLKPINQLTRVTASIADSGNLVSEVYSTKDDEIGSLASSFNRMVEKLRTTSQQLVAERSYSDNIISSIADAVIVTNKANKVVRINQAVTDLTGYEEQDILGRHVATCISPNSRSIIHAIRDEFQISSTLRAVEAVLIGKGGKPINVSISGSLIKDEQGEHRGNVFVAKDITKLKQAQARLNHLANHDTLTGLPNRLLLEDRLSQALSRIEWRDRFVGTLFLDLDRFKLVNDTLGHSAGDQLLKTISERLSRSVRDGDTVARLGGDEFVVVLRDVAQVNDILEIAENIISILRKPINLLGHQYTATTSLGISIAPHHGSDVDTLMKNADSAMYQAKRAGRNTYKVYEPEMHLDSGSIFHLEVALRQALANHEFRVFYQPILDIDGSRIVAAEALVRWVQPDGSLRSPADFLHVAEETGLILPLGRWILETACTEAKKWQDQGNPLLLSVNISDRQFSDPNLVPDIKRILRATDFPARYLDIEMTEGVLVENIDKAMNTLQALKDIGAMISIDDFGTGYSSLAHLKRFPLDRLKIDRSFVSGLPESKYDHALTEAIIKLAETLELKTVAEGVEKEKQLICLRQLGADFLQGYYFSPPVDAEAFKKILIAKNKIQLMAS